MSGSAIGGYYGPRIMVDDAELLRRYANARSEEAFTELVERHLSLVYHAAYRRTGQAQLAEDATQYVFIALARNAAALSRHAVLTGWLYTTTRFAASRILRVERRRQLREQEAYAMQNVLSPPDVDWDRIRPALDGVMDQLSEHDRTAVLLRYFEGRTFTDVGLVLELTEEAARKRVERSVEKLRVLLGRRGIASTSAALAVMLSNQAGLAAPAGLAATVTGAAMAAGGSALASTILSLAGIMSTTKAVFIASGVVALLALGTAGYEWRAQRQLDRSISGETRQIDSLSKHLRTLTERAEVEEETAAGLQKEIEDQRTAAGSRQWDAEAEGRKFMAAHPEARALVESESRNFVIAHYGPFLRSLGLPQDQIGRIEDALVKVGTLVLDSPGGTLDLSTGDRPKSVDEMKSQIREAMGDSIYRQFVPYEKDFEQHALQYFQADRVASDSYLSGVPMTAEQTSQLRQIIIANSATGQSGPVSVAATDWEGVLKQSENVLAPAQMASLQVLASNQAYQAALTLARQASSPIQGSSP